MKITINIPNPRKVWKKSRKVKLTKREAQEISTLLYDFRLSEASEHFIFGRDYIRRLEDLIDAKIYDGRVWQGQYLGLRVDGVFTPQAVNSRGKWVNR